MNFHYPQIVFTFHTLLKRNFEPFLFHLLTIRLLFISFTDPCFIFFYIRNKSAEISYIAWILIDKIELFLSHQRNRSEYICLSLWAVQCINVFSLLAFWYANKHTEKYLQTMLENNTCILKNLYSKIFQFKLFTYVMKWYSLVHKLVVPIDFYLW